MSRTVVRKVDDRPVFVSTLPLRGPVGDVTPAALAAKAAAEAAAAAAGTSADLAAASAASVPTAVNLANSTDAAKGSSLIGHKGDGFPSGPVRARLMAHEGYGQALPYTIQKLYNARLSVQQLVGIALLDSVALMPWQRLAPMLAAQIGQDVQLNYATGSFGDVSIQPVFARLNYGTPASGSVTQLSGQFDRWHTGEVSSLASGTDVKLVWNGVNPTWTSVVVAYLRKAGGGTITPYVGGVAQTAVNTSTGTAGTVGFITLTQAVAQTEVRLVVSGAAVEVAYNYKRDTSRSNLELHPLNFGGLLIDDAMSTAGGRSNLQALIAQIAPTLTVFESKEQSSTLAAQLGLLCDIIDAAAPNSDKILCGSTPYTTASPDDDQRLQNAIIEGVATARSLAGKSYVYIDKYKPFVRGNDPTTARPFLTALGGTFSGDGTHLNILGIEVANTAFNRLGAYLSKYGYMERAVNNRSEPSYLGTGTSIGKSLTQQLTFEAVDGFSFDFNIKAPRSLNFAAGAAANIFGIGDPAQGFGHYFPMDITFNSRTGTRKQRLYTSLGPSYLNWTDTGDTSGHQAIMAGAVRLADHTAATLPAAGGKNAEVRYTTDKGLAFSQAGVWRYIPSIISTRSNAGSAGGGTALPATPEGYYLVSIPGVGDRYVPYYPTT